MSLRFPSPTCRTVVLCFALIAAGRPLRGATADAPPLPDYDMRRATAVSARAGSAEQATAAERLAAVVPGAHVAWDPLLGSPRLVAATDGFLTGPTGDGAVPAALTQGADPMRITRDFIAAHRALFRHGAETLDGCVVARDHRAPHNGIRTVVWQQQADNLPVLDGLLVAHLTARGELISVSSRLLPDAAGAAVRYAAAHPQATATPAISARRAVALAAGDMGETLDESGVTESVEPPAGGRWRRFTAAPLRGTAYAALTWAPLAADSLRLAWEITLTGRARREGFQVVLDAESGTVLLRRGLTDHLSTASYRVFIGDSPTPFSPGHATPLTNQPPAVARVLVTWSALDTNASPQGWIPDGANETLGNNADAHTDWDGNNRPDTPRPSGSPLRVFDPALNLGKDPTDSPAASVVNLFYWCNWMHDRLYQLGFTEGAGNFQTDNLGRGGLGDDAMQADVQDPDWPENAASTTPVDGIPGRIEMGVFAGPTPARDSALDTEIILHELTHGFTRRRLGGGTGYSALQTRGMAEGWSDFLPLTLLAEAGDRADGCYPSAAYCALLCESGFRENYYYGMRRYPYTTNLLKNPLTFRDIDPNQASRHPGVPLSALAAGSASEPHNQGEVWCAMLWEMRANLVAKLGFTNGNARALQLVADGVNLAPPDPSFTEARDAILRADLASGGAHRGAIWAAFAKRGLGYSAQAPDSSTTDGIVEAFDRPDALTVTPVGQWTPAGFEGGPWTPACQEYRLVNQGTGTLNWTARCLPSSYVNLSAAAGALAPGAATIVTACVTAGAALLTPGVVMDTLVFSNATSGAVQPRPAVLEIAGWPDLVIVSAGGPAAAATGESVTLTNVERNIGRGEASWHATRFYLSSDALITTNDTAIGYDQWTTRMAPGASNTNIYIVELPYVLPPGPGYLGAIADSDQQVAESNENNNAGGATPITIRGPDLVVSRLGGPATAGAGYSITVTSVVQNIGPGPSGSMYLWYGLSTDTIITTNDLRLDDDRWIPGLAPGEVVTNEDTLWLGGTAWGKYYLGALVDSRGAVPETNEANNARAGNALAVVGPDMIITRAAGPAMVTIPNTLVVTGVTQNIGGAMAGTQEIGMYLSTDAIVDSNDTLLGTGSWILDVSPGASVTSAVSVYIGNRPPGRYWLGAKADASSQVNETNEANNFLSGAPIDFTVYGPDLAMTAIGGPAGGAAGQVVSLTNTVVNYGPQAASGFYIGFYLCPTPVIGTNGYAIGVRYLSSLATGVVSCATNALALPTSVPPGAYYLGAVADSHNTCTESNKANNSLLAHPFTLAGPDWVVTSFGGPAAAKSAGSVSLTCTVVNAGSGATQSVTVGYYLSADTTITTGDTFLASQAFGSLGPGQSLTLTGTVTILAGLAPDVYQLGAVADCTGTYGETNETNNARRGGPLTVTAGPDFTVPFVGGPTQGVTGGGLQLTNVVANGGSGGAAVVPVGFYLSPDAAITTNDLWLGSRTISTLAAGQSSVATTTVTVANALTGGWYYVGAIADYPALFTEGSEANNTAAGNRIWILGSDLVMTYVGGPTQAVADTTITATNVAQDIGPGGAGNSYVRFYLSEDATLTSNDLLLATRQYIGSFSPGQTVSNRTTVSLAGVAPGGYYLGAMADGNQQVSETNETNNGRLGNRLYLTAPDLVMTQLVGPSTGLPGGSLTVTASVQNIGGANASLQYIKFVLSTGAVITAQDTALSPPWIVNSLAAGQATTTVHMLTLAVVPPGAYHLGVIADAYNYVTETNEDNNTLRGGEIRITGPDLVITCVTGPATAIRYQYVSFTATVANVGLSAAGYHYLQVYFSTDPTITTNDFAAGAFYVDGLDAGQSRKIDCKVQLDDRFAVGTHYVGILADVYNNVAETNENNNLGAGGRITLAGPDLVITRIAGPASGTLGLFVALTNTIRNIGAAAAESCYIGFYLSRDTTVDTNDAFIDRLWQAGLAPGEEATNVFQPFLTGTLAPGTYYLGAIADDYRQVQETNENNNAAGGNLITLSGPELLMQRIGGPTNGVIGGYMTVTDTVANASAFEALGVDVAWYLSPDVAIGTNDIPLGRRSVSMLKAGATNQAVSAGYIEAGVAPGWYYLGAMADPDGAFAETNEANNALAGNKLFVGLAGPDLALTALAGPTHGAAGGPLAVTSSVINAGSVTAPEAEIGFYLSSDADIATNDLRIGLLYLGTVAAGQGFAGPTPVLLPDSVPPGDYYLGGIADPQARLIESNEVNNTRAGNRIRITSVYVPTATAWVRGGTAFTSVWRAAISGSVYQLQRSPALRPAPLWNDVGGPVTAGSSVITLADPGAGATQGYYRVLRLLVP